MPNNMGRITQMAFDAVEVYDTRMELCPTAEEVVAYLQKGKDFKTLSDQIKDTMINAGLCAEDAEQKTFVKILFEGFLKHHPEWGKSEKISKQRAIERWLNGSTKSIRYRVDAIEICLALGINIEQTNEFLNKIGFNQINIRDVEDAVYLYCILQGRSWAVAQRLISTYNSYLSEESVEAETTPVSHTGNTTVILNNELERTIATLNIHLSDWESDESFLNTFLLPNKKHFLGYSHVALKEYYILKNTLFATVVRHNISDEYDSVLEVNKEGYSERVDSVKKMKIIPFSLALRSALRKFKDQPSHILNEANNLLNDDMKNAEEVMDLVCNLIEETSNYEEHIVISEFLQDIIKNEGFLKQVIVSLQDNDTGRLRGGRGNRNSSLKDTVMNEFPRDEAFANFEHSPENNYQKTATRKAIILMYFILYSYSFSELLADGIVNEVEFEVEYFIDRLNTVLSKCKMSKLYPANPFDWLILRCVKEFEVSIYDGVQQSNPLHFFNDVLNFSFDSLDIELDDEPDSE